MKRFLSLLFVMLGVSVLAACNIVFIFDPLVEATVSPEVLDGAGPTQATSSIVLPRESIWFRVDISSTVTSSGEAIYYELDALGDAIKDGSGGGLEIQLYNSGGTVLANSRSAAYFESGSSSLVAGALSGQGISINWFCLGACIIEDTATQTRFVRVRNTTDATVDFDLFVYVRDYVDTGEPENDQLATAIPLSISDAGAVESLGDVDYYEVGSNGVLLFSSDTSIDLQAQIVDSLDRSIGQPLSPGESAPVFVGDFIRVSSVDGRAGAQDVSGYDLMIN
ncbi:MAG: hypothetical protein JSV66_00735 [Trueperaceae bacterium]|nr:MAG: hypothetical protein JSV66_00735 [Trueperaceae bacterium]